MSAHDAEPTTNTSVQAEVTVDVPQEQAFRLFTEQFDKVKPRHYNLLEVDVAETVLEPRVGGDVFDRGVDGTVCRWGRVLAFDPFDSFVISWDLNPRWQVETDLNRTSEVEISFVPVSPTRTRVVVDHRHLERHGDGWEAVSRGVADGWPVFLANFVGLT